MRNSATAISFFILVAVIGSQAGIIHETILEEERSEIYHFKPPVIHQGVHGSSDCCFSYVSRIPCSRFVSYFPTSGGCIKPGIIFVARRRNQVCANPSDPRVQECIKRLKPTIRPGNQAIA
ncbi:C-C motif chemokine 6-like [Peromyscus eremicus]|uniref:C-C motif chemokine 6-like n=1 Tax=Peromyscus eremicus TaxID=42410 RepID=UPI0027DDEF34|nr:C-C motif chemokine 6-like [Peromyscus eremicus]